MRSLARYTYAWTSTSAIGGSASVPSAWTIASSESFHPWLRMPPGERVRYSTKPSPSRSPYSSIQRSAASTAGRSVRGEARGRPSTAGACAVQDQEPRRRVDRAVVRRVRDRRRRRRARPGAARAGSCRAPRRASRPPSCPAGRRGARGRRARGRGFTISSWCDAMRASRPNSVTYQGMPAASIMPPSAVRVDRARRSRRQRVEQLVEQLVVGDDLRGVALPVLVRAPQLVHGDVESIGCGSTSSAIGSTVSAEHPGLVRAEVQAEGDGDERRPRRPRRRRGRCANSTRGHPADVVEPVVGELDRPVAHDRRAPARRASSGTMPRTSKMSAKSAPETNSRSSETGVRRCSSSPAPARTAAR